MKKREKGSGYMKSKLVKRRQIKDYLFRIFSMFMLFLLIFIVPFSYIIQRKAEEYISVNISKSNELVLQQINHDYKYFKEYVSALCLSAYSRSDVQTLMYNSELEYNSIYKTMQSLERDIVDSQPSVNSISIYNAKRNEWYSTDMKGIDTANKDRVFLKDAKVVSKLTPVFRKVNMLEIQDAYYYVFSYFMYEYDNPGKDSSVIVVDQNADWFIEALTEISKSQENTCVYMVSRDGIVYGHKNIGAADDVELLNECVENVNNGEFKELYGNYVAKDESRLVSYLCINDYGDILVLLQDYDEVFGSIRRMSSEFLILVIFFIFLGIVVILILTRILYKPVDELVKYAKKIDDIPVLSEKNQGDEFQHLQRILEHSNMKNQMLQNQKTMRDNILRKLLLGRLLYAPNEKAWEEYRKVLPNTPLCRQKNWELTVVIIKMNEFKENQFDFQMTDEELLLYSVQNVFTELLGQDYLIESTKKNVMETIYVLNREMPVNNQLQILQVLDEVKVFCRKNLDIELTIACSENSNRINELPQLYENAQIYMRHRQIYGDKRILNGQLCCKNLENNAVSCSAESKKHLMKALRIGKVDKIESVLDQIWLELERMNYSNVLFSIMELLTLIHSCISDVYEIRKQKRGTDFNELCSMIMANHTIWEILEELKQYIAGVFDNQCENDKGVMAEKDQQFVEKIVGYIENNYSDMNLSLQSIADYMRLSTRYVSKRFKQCSDISLSDYILNYRMKQAVVLLTDTNLSVGRVAECVGIVNENYFYQLFKKQFGCTPREFKSAGSVMDE